jgi:hypothetical protein
MLMNFLESLFIGIIAVGIGILVSNPNSDTIDKDVKYGKCLCVKATYIDQMGVGRCDCGNAKYHPNQID